MSETDRLTAILQALRAEPNVLVMRNAQGFAKRSGRGVYFGLGEGTADIIAIVGPIGLFLGLEVKEPKEMPTDAQRAWGLEVSQLGGAYAVVHDADGARAAVREARERWITYPPDLKSRAVFLSRTFGFMKPPAFTKSVRMGELLTQSQREAMTPAHKWALTHVGGALLPSPTPTTPNAANPIVARGTANDTPEHTHPAEGHQHQGAHRAPR